MHYCRQCAAFTLYLVACIVCGIVLLWYNYNLGRTNTFISVDDTSGVCAKQLSSTKCCEIPIATTGDFLIDADGNWESSPNFHYLKQAYGIRLQGLETTNANWAVIMKTFRQNLYEIAVVRGHYRDFSWNLIAWASFTQVDKSSGIVQLYTAADIGVMFNKPIVSAGYASRASDSNHEHNGLSSITNCNPDIITSYSLSSRILTVNTDLNTANNKSSQYCSLNSENSLTCLNPCPGILAPQAMGYNLIEAESSVMTWSIDMAAVVTAIAVNMGIVPLRNLQKFPNDFSRLALFNAMLRNGSIDESIVNRTSSYYETLRSPVPPIYW